MMSDEEEALKENRSLSLQVANRDHKAERLPMRRSRDRTGRPNIRFIHDQDNIAGSAFLLRNFDSVKKREASSSRFLDLLEHDVSRSPVTCCPRFRHHQVNAA
jgi:hypothetical protein